MEESFAHYGVQERGRLAGRADHQVELVKLDGGELTVAQRSWDKIDVGTYKPSDSTMIARIRPVAAS
jgi:hypothetical protein